MAHFILLLSKHDASVQREAVHFIFNIFRSSESSSCQFVLISRVH